MTTSSFTSWTGLNAVKLIAGSKLARMMTMPMNEARRVNKPMMIKTPTASKAQAKTAEGIAAIGDGEAEPEPLSQEDRPGSERVPSDEASDGANKLAQPR